MTAEPSNPTRRLPNGSVAAPSNSNGILTELDAPNGQVTSELQGGRAGLSNVGGDECDLRVLLHGEEVVAAQVGITLLVAGVDAGRLNGQLAGRLGEVGAIDNRAALELVERAADLGDHCVPGYEPDTSVARVDDVAAGQV